MKADQGLYIFFLIWYGCGVILLSFDLLPAWLEWANVVFLIVAGTLGGVYFHHTYGPRTGFILSAAVVLLSIFIEFLGVEYGIMFGDYYYTSDFGPQLLGVPIAIGFAWLMVMAGSHAIMKAIWPGAPLLLFSTAGALLAVMIDLILDPVAYKVKAYWVWTADSFYYNIPFSNFAGWFITAFILHLLIGTAGKKKYARSVRWQNRAVMVYFLVFAMFVLLAAIDSLWLAVTFSLTPAVLVLTGYIFSIKRGSHDRSPQKQVV
ncbi:carotenoid biosynthesis protein [Bacillus mangrovi]|uniref:Carotenoid biosynthesis protein n=1 Tax=Metabacillus mangrovi TaxID=1491830 RepID=A0A7X2S5R7_9BACI|nr:carotenoid biosynthesis protein [Metabacillus mangrovi]MTH53301.1 carotenoid biosynthesis protein [Metabacillus mangrovi]